LSAWDYRILFAWKISYSFYIILSYFSFYCKSKKNRNKFSIALIIKDKIINILSNLDIVNHFQFRLSLADFIIQWLIMFLQYMSISWWNLNIKKKIKIIYKNCNNFHKNFLFYISYVVFTILLICTGKYLTQIWHFFFMVISIH